MYVGSQRDDAVYVLDAADAPHITLPRTIATGSHPVALLLNRDQSKLFVANAHSDTISILDTASESVIGTILLRPQVRARSGGGDADRTGGTQTMKRCCMCRWPT